MNPFSLVLAGAILGSVAGSFLATLAIRWPQARSIAYGRSSCDECTRRLSPIELVPVLSFLIQRGRCRTCNARIDWRHPVIELAASLIGALSLLNHDLAAGFAGALFGWLLLTLAALDLEHLWLPDRITMPTLALGLLMGALGISPSLVDRSIGAAAAFLTLASIAVLYRRLRGRTGMGAGDPKLFAAIGAWLGWAALPVILLCASLLGLAVAAGWRLAGRQIARSMPQPFGAFLAAAAWPIWWFSTGS